MNLAILVSVSKYANSQNDLPACANDFSLIDSILTHSGKFTEVLRLESDTTSAKVKSDLAHFVKAHKATAVDELFFFYTGHGDFYHDDFYFLLSDFDDDKRQQTALSNAELDSMMRSLSPKLAIKVVDACYSGVPYVKNANILEKSLDASKGKFDRCYFMFSSKKEQPSFQDDHLSDFTESFARSILQRSQDTIRYKDIADYISDEFEHKGHQTPAFVLQADLTDVFCSISSELRDDLTKRLQKSVASAAAKQDDTTTGTTTPEQQPSTSLYHLAVRESKRFCTEAEAMNALNGIKVAIEAYTLREELSGLYELELSVKSDFTDIPKMDSVASWLDKNQNDYFVQVQYREEEYEDTIRVPKIYGGLLGSHFRTMAALTGDDYETRSVTRKKQVPNAVMLTATPPYCTVEATLKPKFENLPWLKEFVVLVFSKSTLRLFYAIVRLKETNWSERELLGEVKWKTKEVGFKDNDALLASATKMIDEFVETVSKALRDRYGLNDETKDKAGDHSCGGSDD